jgi:hypothetical protein
MRTLDAAEITHLQARAGSRPRILVWIKAKNISTGAIEPVGFWQGEDDQSFTVSGATRLYHGAGGLIGIDDLTVEVGLSVRTLQVWFATAAQEVIDAVRGYDLRLAQVEIHRVLTHPLTHAVIATPHRIWKGWADGAPLTTPAIGDESGKVTLTVASAAMALTRSLTGKFSDGSMSLRGPGDRLFKYADVSGKVPVYWGETRHG